VGVIVFFLAKGIFMNSNKHFCLSLSLAVTVVFSCMVSWSAFAADATTVAEQATEQVAKVAPPVNYTSPDTYVKIVQMAKEWMLANLPHLIVAFLIFVIGRMIANWITSMAKRAFRKGDVEPTLHRFLCKIIYYILMSGVILAAAGELGIQTTSFLAIVGAAGLAIGLALKDSLSNFASGVMLILFRPFKVGDVVTAGGITGKVYQVDIFSTIIHTADNQRQIIPNSTITASVITNINAEETRRIDLVVGIGYDDDIKLAKTTLIDLMAADLRILTDPVAGVAVADLGASSVDLNVRPWVKTEDYWSVRGDLTEAIKVSFDEKGISFPYPQQDVHMFQTGE
jgi:small conductance mechanosensitive channel